MTKKIDIKRLNGVITDTKQIERNGVNIGIIEGYIATWDLDRGDWRYKDQFTMGCFSESIQQFKNDKRMPRLKDHHGRTIGGWQYESLKEDSRGLFGVGEINIDVQQGREAYSLAKQDVLTDLSIGFGANEFTIDEVNKIRTITKATLGEGSIVDEPMNPKANITAVKTAISELPESLVELFDFVAKSIGVYGNEQESLSDELKEAINERFKKENRSDVIDGDILIIDKVSAKELTERQLEGIMSSNKAMLTKQASKTLISYLNFQGMRDAVKEKGRDAQKDSETKAKLETLIKLMENN